MRLCSSSDLLKLVFQELLYFPLSSIDRKVGNVLGEGAYDGAAFRRVARDAGANCIVPPPKNARYKKAKDGAWVNFLA